MSSFMLGFISGVGVGMFLLGILILLGAASSVFPTTRQRMKNLKKAEVAKERETPAPPAFEDAVEPKIGNCPPTDPRWPSIGPLPSPRIEPENHCNCPYCQEVKRLKSAKATGKGVEDAGSSSE